jgi:hypothetical protein
MMPHTAASHQRTFMIPLVALSLLAYPLLYGAGVFASGSVPGDHARLQLLLFPLVFALLTRVTMYGVKVPRWVFGIAALGCVCGAIFTYTHVDLARGAFVVARFAEDTLETETKITRDRIRLSVGPGAAALVGSHHEPVVSRGDARRVLEGNWHLGGLVWGTPRWLTVSLARHPNISVGVINRLAETGKPQAASLSGFTLITSVDEIGISGSSDPATVEFIGRLIPLWANFSTVLTGRDGAKHLEQNGAEHFEQSIRSLSLVKARWTSFSHRALPMWMTGTYHLAHILMSGEIERGEVLCALTAFEAARAQLRPGDNPELEAAILNNHGIAVYLDALVSARPSQRRTLGAALLRRAATIAAGGHAERVLSVVKSNLNYSKGGNGGSRKKKQR